MMHKRVAAKKLRSALCYNAKHITLKRDYFCYNSKFKKLKQDHLAQLVTMKLSARFQLINESWTLFVQSFKNPSRCGHIVIILPCLNPGMKLNLIKSRECDIFRSSPHHP